MGGISWSGVLLRMIFAIALVLLTFNPSGHSFSRSCGCCSTCASLHDSGTVARTWIGLIIAGAILGIGLSWSLIRARTTGQIETQ